MFLFVEHAISNQEQAKITDDHVCIPWNMLYLTIYCC